MAAGAAVGHLQRGRKAAGGDEAELARGDRVAAAGDDHRAEPAERGRAPRPVGEGRQRVASPPVAVLGDRALVGEGRVLGADELLRVALFDDAKSLRENEQVRKAYLGED